MNIVDDEADLIILVDGKAVFLRTVRLPGPIAEEKTVHRLLAEINRTLAVGLQDELEARKIRRVHVFGRPGDHQSLRDQVGVQLGVPVEIFDPFQAVTIAEEAIPEDAGRFAPLLGMAIDEAGSRAHAIDFLRVRKRVRPFTRKRKVLTALTAATIVALAGALFVWDQITVADAEVQELSDRLKDLGKLLKQAGGEKQIVGAVHDWLAGDVDWLDELRDLSIRLPSGRDMVLSRIMMSSAPRSGGGDVDIKGLVRDPSVVTRMESGVRDKYHEVRSKRIRQELVREKAYTWHFETSMSVGRRDKSQYTSHLPEQAQEPAAEEPAAPTARKTRPSKRSAQAEQP